MDQTFYRYTELQQQFFNARNTKSSGNLFFWEKLVSDYKANLKQNIFGNKTEDEYFIDLIHSLDGNGNCIVQMVNLHKFLSNYFKNSKIVNFSIHFLTAQHTDIGKFFKNRLSCCSCVY
jgi:hypothetical protein